MGTTKDTLIMEALKRGLISTKTQGRSMKKLDLQILVANDDAKDERHARRRKKPEEEAVSTEKLSAWIRAMFPRDQTFRRKMTRAQRQAKRIKNRRKHRRVLHSKRQNRG